MIRKGNKWGSFVVHVRIFCFRILICFFEFKPLYEVAHVATNIDSPSTSCDSLVEVFSKLDWIVNAMRFYAYCIQWSSFWNSRELVCLHFADFVQLGEVEIAILSLSEKDTFTKLLIEFHFKKFIGSPLLFFWISWLVLELFCNYFKTHQLSPFPSYTHDHNREQLSLHYYWDATI